MFSCPTRHCAFLLSPSRAGRPRLLAEQEAEKPENGEVDLLQNKQFREAWEATKQEAKVQEDKKDEE